MKRLLLVVCTGLLVLTGCGESSDSGNKAAEQAAQAAEAAQEQVSELQSQVNQQAKALQQQKEQAAYQAASAARKAAKKARKQARTQQAAAAEPVEPSGPPNVVGLTLTTAEQMLKSAGYRADADNTDTMFGIVNTDNYTVCTQDAPRGKIVPVLAQKYGC